MFRVFAYLQQHPVSGIFYYREAVPARLQSAIGTREIKKSLGTGRKTEAIRLAQRLHVKTLDLFEEAERQMTAKKKPSDILADLEILDGPHKGEIHRVVIQTKDGNKVTIERDNPAEEAEIVSRLLNNLPAGTAVHTAKRGRPRKDEKIVSLSDMIRKYFTEIEATGTQQRKTIAENQAIFQVLVELLKNPAAETIGLQEATAFKSALLRLPSNRDKGATAGKSVAELLRMKHPKTMSNSSVNKYLRRVSALFAWGKRHGFTNDNPFTGLAIRSKVLPHQLRQRFTFEDIQRLLDPENLPPDAKRSYQFWLPWLGLYTGARLEELCQLHLADIRQERGLWVLDINAKDEKRVKTLSSERLIPVHPRLIELGFLSHVEGLRQNGEQRVFPELKYRRDGYGQTASNWFSRYRQRLGIDKPFHSLRHTFVDELHQLGEDHKKIAALVGHADESMTGGRYSKPFSPAVLHPVICKLSFPS